MMQEDYNLKERLILNSNTSWDGDNNVTKDFYTSSFKCRQPTLLFSPSLSGHPICGWQGVLPVLGQGISIRYRVASLPN